MRGFRQKKVSKEQWDSSVYQWLTCYDVIRSCLSAFCCCHVVLQSSPERRNGKGKRT